MTILRKCLSSVLPIVLGGTGPSVQAQSQPAEPGAETSAAEAPADDANRERLERLERRVDELEEELQKARVANEDATRWIIRDAMSTLGTQINESVSLSGTLEVITGGTQVFQGQSERVLRLNTAQVDLGIQVNPWTQGLLSLAYNDGAGTVFPTVDGSEASVDRITLDVAHVTLGDPQRFPAFATAGKQTVPFGTTTGSVVNVPTITDPLTIEVFETKEDAILFGLAGPTPAITPTATPVSPPRVDPQVVNPIVSSVSRLLGYSPPPTPPPQPVFVIPAPPPPAFNFGVYIYNGNTRKQSLRRDARLSENTGATFGYQTRGSCGRSFQELAAGGSWLQSFCPWSIDVDVDFSNSVFDSLFLESEYRPYLNQIEFVQGMAASVKGNFGPVGYVAEWNGAINDATFTDDLGTPINIRPSTWQLSLAYQFDWNPWVDVIGAQGTYFSIGYSESRELAGVTRVISGIETRVGAVPKSRVLVSLGEWVLDGVRLAVELSHVRDYPLSDGGTGRTANGLFTMLTYEW